MKLSFLEEPVLKPKINLLPFLTALLFLASCIGTNQEVWVFEAKRKIDWAAAGYASKPQIQGKYVIFNGGYNWQNQIYLHVVDRETGQLVWRCDVPTDQFKVGKEHVVILTKQSIFEKSPARANSKKLICYKLKNGYKYWEKSYSIGRAEPRILSVIDCVNLWIPGQELSSLELDSGEYLWNNNLERIRVGRVRWAQVIAQDDKIFVAVPGVSAFEIDRKSGKHNKKYSLAFMPQEPVVYLKVLGDRMVIFDRSGQLSVLDMNNDKVILQKKVGGLLSEIAHENDRIFFATKDGMKGNETFRLHSIKLEEDDKYWSKKFAQAFVGKPGASKSHVFIGTAGSDNQFYGLNTDTGEVSWKTDIGPVKGNAEGQDGVVYVCGKSHFYAIDETNGKTIWKVKPKQFEPAASPTLYEDKVFFVGEDSFLYCLKQAENLGKKSMKNEVDKLSKK